MADYMAWRHVVRAPDYQPCPECDETVCPVCECHYSNCECPGPMMEGYLYLVNAFGQLMARPMLPWEREA
jgi:hypothetical protein